MLKSEYAGVLSEFGAVVERRECRYDIALLVTATELVEKPYLAKNRSIIQIDTLRNSTVITVALAAGASGVKLFGKRPDGLERLNEQASLFEGLKLKAGEVEGRPIPGFDLGNSPLDFTRERVNGHMIFHSSTNNGNAMENLSDALGDFATERKGEIVWGCMLNGRAVGSVLAKGSIPLPILFLCAGFRGTLAMEDLLCAGQIMLAAQSQGMSLGTLDDSATAALKLSQLFFTPDGEVREPATLASEMSDWRCGSVLSLLNQTSDIMATITGEGIDAQTLKRVRNCIPRLINTSHGPCISAMSYLSESIIS